MERAFPQIKRVRQHVGLAAKRELRGFARLNVLGFEAFPRLAAAALFREVKSVFQTPLDPAPRVHRFLNGHFIRRALEHETARADVKTLVIFTDHDEINVFRPLVLERTIGGAVQLHRAQIDVLFQLETEAEQDAFFKDARLDLGMAHRAEENRLELAQFVHRAIRQHLARLKITVAAKIVMVPVDLETEFLGGGLGDFEGLAGDFRPRAVAADDCNVVGFHKFVSSPRKLSGRKKYFNIFQPGRNGILHNG